MILPSSYAQLAMVAFSVSAWAAETPVIGLPTGPAPFADEPAPAQVGSDPSQDVSVGRTVPASIVSMSSAAAKTSGPAESPAPQSDDDWQVDRIEGGTLYFKSRKPLVTDLHEVSVIGKPRPTEGKLPYFLITARPCKGGNCLDERSLYLIRADGAKRGQYVRPGKILDPKNQGIILESRAFYGKCLPDFGDVYVAFQKDLIERKRRGRRSRSMEPSVLVAEPGAEGIFEKLSELRRPGQLQTRQQAALRQVKHKQCFEITGDTRKMASRPMDVRPRDNSDGDVEEVDETPTEATAAASPESPDGSPSATTQAASASAPR